jgi:DinB superfamily
LAGPITDSVHAKVREQIELTLKLIDRLPDDLQWRPLISQRTMDVGHLLGHLLECLSGFCAVFYAGFPEQMTHLIALKDKPVNHLCAKDEARLRIHEYSACIAQGFSLCRDEDLARRIPSVFVPKGETLITLLLGNLEHLMNHKYQLYFYLKSMGVMVGTRDLYRFREEAAESGVIT